MTAEQHANLYEQHEWKHPTQVAGIPWKNPVATASGTFQYAAVRWFYDVSQLGAVTTKGVSPVPWEGNPGIRTAEGPSSNINAVEVGAAALFEPTAPLRVARELDDLLDERPELADKLAKGETWR